MTTFYTLSWGEIIDIKEIITQFSIILPGICGTKEIGWNAGAIDFYPVHFMFPEGGYTFCAF